MYEQLKKKQKYNVKKFKGIFPEGRLSSFSDVENQKVDNFSTKSIYVKNVFGHFLSRHLILRYSYKCNFKKVGTVQNVNIDRI